MDMATEIPAVTELVVALEQATLMAKQLPKTTNQSQIIQIYSTLHSAHHHLSTFLSQTTLQSYPPPQPSLLPLAAAENSVSSAVGNDLDDEPMQLGDYDYDNDNEGEVEGEQNFSKIAIESVEERMRDCFIKNKRPKRSLSPASVAAAEERRRRWSYDEGFVKASSGSGGFDPHLTKLRSLDLIQQFHAWS